VPKADEGDELLDSFPYHHRPAFKRGAEVLLEVGPYERSALAVPEASIVKPSFGGTMA
jgi:hypothetical protein